MTLDEAVPRRTFLIDAARLAAAGFITVELQLLLGCARDNGKQDGAFANLSAAEARTMRSLASQIIPAEGDLPGAEKAGVVYFVDRAFGMPFFADSATIIRGGLADLDSRAHAAGGHRDFASAPDAEQLAILSAIETTPFFAAARTMVVIGMFADPSYGGNRGAVGWSLLGLEHHPMFSAPFGWYDAHQPPDVATKSA
jgi:Gluconate 2-dehydrogenase subunit 3